MLRLHIVGLAALVILAPSAFATAANVGLGASDLFALFGGASVTNTGASRIHGEVGAAPGSPVMGFPPVMITGGIVRPGDVLAQQAQRDLKDAYNFAADQACESVMTGQDLGGLTLTPGVYCFESSAQLTGTLTLDAGGDAHAVFLFKVANSLTSSSGSSVAFLNEGQGGSVVWHVGDSVTLGADSAFTGSILALNNITFNNGANIDCGRALSQKGDVNLDTNDVFIDSPGCLSSMPEPGTAMLLGTGLLLGLIAYKWPSLKQVPSE